jgi:hypothetical protein
MEREDSKSHGRGIGIVAIVLVCVPLVIYLPLVLAAIEAAAFGTRTVEDICEFLGIHGILSKIYDSTIFWIF